MFFDSLWALFLLVQKKECFLWSHSGYKRAFWNKSLSQGQDLFFTVAMRRGVWICVGMVKIFHYLIPSYITARVRDRDSHFPEWNLVKGCFFPGRESGKWKGGNAGSEQNVFPPLVFTVSGLGENQRVWGPFCSVSAAAQCWVSWSVIIFVNKLCSFLFTF